MTGVCRVCRCTDEEACLGGCEWVEPDLCDTCAMAIAAILAWGEAAYFPDVTALFREAMTSFGTSLSCIHCGEPITIENAAGHICKPAPLKLVRP